MLQKCLTTTFENIRVQSNYIDIIELPQYTYSSPISAVFVSEYLLKGTSIEIIDTKLAMENAESTITSEKGLCMNLLINTDDNGYVEIPRFN